jgi:hypothetical protein
LIEKRSLKINKLWTRDNREKTKIMRINLDQAMIYKQKLKGLEIKWMDKLKIFLKLPKG